eukprot:1160912-Pelagomonas_calceolata.AAC.2
MIARSLHLNRRPHPCFWGSHRFDTACYTTLGHCNNSNVRKHWTPPASTNGGTATGSALHPDLCPELLQLLDVLPARFRATALQHPDLPQSSWHTHAVLHMQLVEVVMDLGRPPAMRLPPGRKEDPGKEVALSLEATTFEDLQEAEKQPPSLLSAFPSPFWLFCSALVVAVHHRAVLTVLTLCGGGDEPFANRCIANRSEHSTKITGQVWMALSTESAAYATVLAALWG